MPAKLLCQTTKVRATPFYGTSYQQPAECSERTIPVDDDVATLRLGVNTKTHSLPLGGGVALAFYLSVCPTRAKGGTPKVLEIESTANTFTLHGTKEILHCIHRRAGDIP